MSNNLMTCAECDELFLDFFEGSLEGSDRTRFDEHVSTCLRCQGLIRDIDGIRDQAAALPEMIPSRDLWSGIDSRIQPQVRSISAPRHAPLSKRWLAAAAAALVLATSGVTYLATSRSSKTPRAANAPATIVESPHVAMATPEPSAASEDGQAATSPIGGAGTTEPARAPSIPGRSAPGTSLASSSSAAMPVTASELAFAGQITQLQSVLVERRAQLDPETVKIVEDNLKLIDTAVKRARSALAKDPASGFLTRQLDNALQKKVELLRTVALLPAST